MPAFIPKPAIPCLYTLLAASATLFILPNAVAEETDDCKPGKTTHQMQVNYIHDGDTLWLVDGTKVRVIGLNTPELARKETLGEPLAEKARDALRQLIQDEINLEYDTERQDRHGRLLAHLYSKSGDNLAARLIAQGLAFAVAFPPNLKHSRCYRAAERVARAAGLGVWSAPYFEPVAAREVRQGGFMRVKGCVKNTRNTRKTTYLKLAPDFRLKMHRADFDGFLKPLSQHSPPDFSGACMIVRGWVYNDRRTDFKTMTIRHPDNVETIRRP